MVDPTGRRAPERRQPPQDQLARDWRGCLPPLAAGDDDVFAPPPPSHGLPRHLLALTGGDARLDAAARRALRLVGKDIPLLIEGETGTGKEVFAQAFHASSPRRDPLGGQLRRHPGRPDRIELFGYEDGAFTGARRKRTTAALPRRTAAARCFWMKSAICRSACKPTCCACCKSAEVTPLGAQRANRGHRRGAPPTATRARRWPTGVFGKIYITAWPACACAAGAARTQRPRRTVPAPLAGKKTTAKPWRSTRRCANGWTPTLAGQSAPAAQRAALGAGQPRTPDDALDLRHLDERPSPPRLHLAPARTAGWPTSNNAPSCTPQRLRRQYVRRRPPAGHQPGHAVPAAARGGGVKAHPPPACFTAVLPIRG